MRRFCLVLLLTAVSFGQLMAQLYETDALNMEKYWYLRKRLNERFVKVGPNPGESMPVDIYRVRAFYTDDPTSEIFKRIDFGGDATARHGWYIGVLATELKLLRDGGEDYSVTADELWYALNTIDRLDDVAELVYDYAPYDWNCNEGGLSSFFSLITSNPQYQINWDPVNKKWLPRTGSAWINSATNRNGFFLRGDAPYELLNYFTDADDIRGTICQPWNPDINWPDDLFLKLPGYGLQHYHFGYFGDAEESQDQLFHILMGLMLTVEFVDPSVQSHGESLFNKANAIGRRLLDHYSPWYQITNPTYNPSDPRWVCKGNDSFWFQESIDILKSYFELNGAYTNHDNVQGLYPYAVNVLMNTMLTATIATLANSCSHYDLCNYLPSSDWKFYVLLRRALYPHGPVSGCDYTTEEIREDLDLCPCRGPYFDEYEYNDGTYERPDGTFFRDPYFGDNGPPEPLWRPEKWNRPNRYTPGGTATGEFNGLDYMLLFNLAKIDGADEGANIVPYTNMIYHDVHDPFPSVYSYTPVAFRDMTCDLTVPINKRMHAQASGSIDLLPGFQTVPGAFFLGEIKSGAWTCDGVTYKNSGVQPPPRQRVLLEANPFPNFVPEPLVEQRGFSSGQTSEVMMGIFPNPTSDYFTINCSVNGILNIRITDMSGKVLLDRAAVCGEQIGVGEFSAGTYHVVIMGSEELKGDLAPFHQLLIKTE